MTEKWSASLMESPKDDRLDQDEVLERLTRGFGALLQKVESLARKNAEFEQQIRALQAKVGLQSSSVTALSCVMKRKYSSRS